MKKTYISPETISVEISTMSILAGTTVDLNSADEYSEGGTLSGARGYGAWDSDED